MKRNIVRAAVAATAALVAVYFLIPALVAHQWGYAALVALCCVLLVALAIVGPPFPATKVDRTTLRQLRGIVDGLPVDRLLARPGSFSGYQIQKIPVPGAFAVLRSDVREWQEAVDELQEGQPLTTMTYDRFLFVGRTVRRYSHVVPIKPSADGGDRLFERASSESTATELRNLRFADRHGLSTVTEQEIHELITDLREVTQHRPEEDA